MSVDQILAKAEFYSDDVLYRLVQIPKRAMTLGAGIIAEIGEPFTALIVDKDEVTLVIPSELVAEFETRLNRLPAHQVSQNDYRLITLDVVLEPDLVGLMARISTALAEAGVSLLPLAAFSRDHLLVAAPDFERAMDVLGKLGH